MRSLAAFMLGETLGRDGGFAIGLAYPQFWDSQVKAIPDCESRLLKTGY
jgi:hypothetical protein